METTACGLIGLTQQAAIEAMAKTYNVLDSNPTKTPMEVKPNLTKDQMPEPGSEEHLEMKDIPYRNLLGSLNYISEITRGDIQGAVSVLARFACNPALVHWKALKRILIYLYH